MAITFTGGVMVPTAFGNDAVTQHIFALENHIGSRVDVNVRRLTVQNDPLTALTSVMPQVKVSRGVNISGGIMLDKAQFRTTETSDPFVKIRSALGEGSPITATRGDTIWQQYTSRLHTAVEQVIASDEPLLPRLVDTFDFKLEAGGKPLGHGDQRDGSKQPGSVVQLAGRLHLGRRPEIHLCDQRHGHAFGQPCFRGNRHGDRGRRSGYDKPCLG